MVITEKQEYLTEKEAAKHLDIEESVLKSERYKKRIKPYVIAGGRVRYTHEILNTYVANHPLNSKDSNNKKADNSNED